jgi:hypothetical protein
MAPHEATRPGCRRTLLSLILIALAVSLCIGSTVTAIDSLCYAAQAPLLPYYPGARVVRINTSAPRPFGWGETVVQLESDDDPSTVRDWYGGRFGRALGERADGPLAFMSGTARTSYRVRRADDGTGSTITLRATCAA